MGTLALDIETASPFEEPSDMTDTDYFEWLSVALAYVDDDAASAAAEPEPETAVLFRRGGWEKRYTADLLDRLVEWCESRAVSRTLTYNGARFDLQHMVNWAASLERSGVRPDAVADLTDCLPRHVDVARAAADRYADEVWEGREILPDWKAYELAGIDNSSVRYADYDFDDGYREGLDVDGGFVGGADVGRVLGQRYVEGVVAGIEATHTHRELRRLLYDYSVSDVDDLYRLYRSLGGAELDGAYGYPVEELLTGRAPSSR